MKPRALDEMLRAKERIERGDMAPARVWAVRPDGKGGFTRRLLHPRRDGSRSVKAPTGRKAGGSGADMSPTIH